MLMKINITGIGPYARRFHARGTDRATVHRWEVNLGSGAFYVA